MSVPIEKPTRKSIFDPDEMHTRKLPDGTLIRFFESFGSGYRVQIIINPGIRDRRLKKYKQERRCIIFKSKDRPEAVAFFNETLQSETARLQHNSHD